LAPVGYEGRQFLPPRSDAARRNARRRGAGKVFGRDDRGRREELRRRLRHFCVGTAITGIADNGQEVVDVVRPGDDALQPFLRHR
jgi:hypothetical protein